MSLNCLFAAIADDFTGGADLAGMLFQNGVPTVLIFGDLSSDLVRRIQGKYAAAVVCLKTRSIEPHDARRLSLEALRQLQLLNPAQIQFKYCSTFDSTRRGNIGPVLDALMDRMDVSFTIAVPALPVNQRTQYLGHLFVGSQLLSESPLRHHPLNPMDDANLVRYLQAQTSRRVGLVALPVIQGGPDAIRRRMKELEQDGIAIALMDAVCDADLQRIAEATHRLPLISGGSGLGITLPSVWRRDGLLRDGPPERPSQLESDRLVVALSGSCSAATLKQLEYLRGTGREIIAIDVAGLVHNPENEIERLYCLVQRALTACGEAIVSSSAPPHARQSSPEISVRIEDAFASLARRLVQDAGVHRLAVAGGETSGAIVSALGIPAVEIVGILDPGVPSLRSISEPPLALALKSGNFGSEDFFVKAIEHLRTL